MYTYSILWFLSWPVLILVSLFIIRWAVKRLEQKESQGEGNTG